jgi:hypothetical protein
VDWMHLVHEAIKQLSKLYFSTYEFDIHFGRITPLTVFIKYFGVT